MKNFVMLSGLPRTGSTVLTSMLNQHPEIYASTTSPLSDFIIATSEQWPVLSQQVAEKPTRQLENVIGGIIDGCYKHINKPIIIDKNRLWPRLSELMCSVQQHKPKIICTVRPIPEILTSYILLFDRYPHQKNFVDEELKNKNIPINTKNRCKILWEVYINHPYKSLLMGYNNNNSDMLFIKYDDIVNNGQKTIDNICQFIGIDSCPINVNDLQPMDENDKFHGFIGLHDVRKELRRISPLPEEVIGRELTQLYNNMRLEFWNKL